MIIVDTNVVAELMKTAPAPEVVAFLNEQAAADLFLTAITLGEIGFGIEMLPFGKRRVQLERGLRRVADKFGDRILPFDEAAASHYGPLMAKRRSIGRPLAALDGQIAAIARAKGATVATRNVRDFESCGVDLLNPFPDGR